MHNTISQLQSEFSEDIIKIDGSAEDNCRNPELLDQIEDQVQRLSMKVKEMLNEIENEKNGFDPKNGEPKKENVIKKPNDEIKFWKSKGAKLNKAYKLTQDDRVKVLTDTLLYANNNYGRNSKVLDDYKKQMDEL
jgi:hypothetical protein